MESNKAVLDINLKRKCILMVAFDFPPCHSAGVQRTLKFAEYLYHLGWQPIVLTVNGDVHRNIDNSQLVPDYIKVYRSNSLDASKHFSFKGKYFAWSKVPDKWWTWSFTAIPLGKKLINKYKPTIVWSTYPISTAHFIAYRLQKYSGLPWVADYRDPLQSRYDQNSQRYSGVAKWIEKKTIKTCSKVIFTTVNAAKLYQRIYPDEHLSKFITIENGYDEGNFKGIEKPQKSKEGKFTLLHSGAIYDAGRDPTNLFSAISISKENGTLNAENFELFFRGSADSHKYSSKLTLLGINELVTFLPSIPYKDSLKEMMSVDGLLVIQGSLFNNQIPGKVYEYLRVGIPILGVTPKKGATGNLLLNNNQDIGDDVDDICKSLGSLLLKEQSGLLSESIEKFSRKYQTSLLASVLDKI